MSEVRVDLGSRGYAVRIENGLVDRAGAALAPYVRSGRLLVVSDEQVWAAQGGRLKRGLRDTDAVPLLVPPGETSKSWTVLADLIDRLVAHGIERGEAIVAFGGGMVGDLAGFAAAIVNRGTPFVQLPTSLLAQVDSSVGGKTGINIPTGKNLVGTFHQPAMVLIDPLCLDTLDRRQLRAGYAEIVKYALIADADFFVWLEGNADLILAGDTTARAYAIALAVAGKAAIVAKDEYEEFDIRILLNLGHTFAHAIEAASEFSASLLHGEAVAAGLILAFDLSAERGLCLPQDAARVRRHLASLGFAPVPVDGSIVAYIKTDKKRRHGRIPFILARGIGKAFVDRSVELEEVAAFLDRRSN